MTQPHEKRRRLREMLKADQPVVAPGIYDGLTARLVEQAGFDAAIVTGAGVSASLLGAPDVGLVTMSEVLTQTRNIANAVDICVVADCDTGYGNPLNVGRTIREFENGGVAGLFIEDQVSPKRCGHFAGKQIIPAEDMVQKLRAAVDARVDPELVLIARTDARATDGIEEAVRRGRLYAEAGADMIFVEAPHTYEELEFVGGELSSLGLPLMVNLVEGGKTPLVSVDDLAKLGFSFITFSGSLQKTAIKVMQEMLGALMRDGEVTAFYPSKMVSLEERSELLGLPRYFELERRYASSP
ncbi:carboxyvinyl-carboxyphosphonate phosphorylmutase [Mycolicibacterium agri]|uniref:Carboxyvinyl-carboxyphosphonate phosphorylmutase n=1 Tax=Mycolicibacterium agri TaxID=36811 RepID=A0A2A7N9V1_MYCAG|nr:isocitrate lyase/PEP mutase family protein [Mycolicibacterium agri]PEG40636.1 carboxyvinyl-carboxyphosphonate phosphorylmutase [Mycolicibacterium agri]GFG50379.1 carboxyvinyl-carboxyphosphonate phosphorylmutase [Mycolicibacterium agri]